VQWDRDDALQVVYDDLKSRPDLVVARLAGRRNNMRLPTTIGRTWTLLHPARMLMAIKTRAVNLA
jgi:hypothetical protein